MKAASVLKTARELDRLRDAGRVAHLALEAACAAVGPGVTTSEIDAVAEEVIRAHGATPEFMGYRDYPAATCISVNEEVVHGIPSGRRLSEGDLVSIDVGARMQGYVGDNAATVVVGSASEAVERMCEVGRECLRRAVDACWPGRPLSDIGQVIQSHAETQGYSIVRDYAGHGIGAEMHEEPQVPNYVDERVLANDRLLEIGLCLAIEPMINMGGPGVRVLDDQWTVVTEDGSFSAHWEDVVAVTADGPRILTRP